MTTAPLPRADAPHDEHKKGPVQRDRAFFFLGRCPFGFLVLPEKPGSRGQFYRRSRAIGQGRRPGPPSVA